MEFQSWPGEWEAVEQGRNEILSLDNLLPGAKKEINETVYPDRSDPKGLDTS